MDDASTLTAISTGMMTTLVMSTQDESMHRFPRSMSLAQHCLSPWPVSKVAGTGKKEWNMTVTHGFLTWVGLSNGFIPIGLHRSVRWITPILFSN